MGLAQLNMVTKIPWNSLYFWYFVYFDLIFQYISRVPALIFIWSSLLVIWVLFLGIEHIAPNSSRQRVSNTILAQRMTWLRDWKWRMFLHSHIFFRAQKCTWSSVLIIYWHHLNWFDSSFRAITTLVMQASKLWYPRIIIAIGIIHQENVWNTGTPACLSSYFPWITERLFTAVYKPDNPVGNETKLNDFKYWDHRAVVQLRPHYLFIRFVQMAMHRWKFVF